MFSKIKIVFYNVKKLQKNNMFVFKIFLIFVYYFLFIKNWKKCFIQKLLHSQFSTKSYSWIFFINSFLNERYLHQKIYTLKKFKFYFQFFLPQIYIFVFNTLLEVCTHCILFTVLIIADIKTVTKKPVFKNTNSNLKHIQKEI